jgi:hypothetical protein
MLGQRQSFPKSRKENKRPFPSHCGVIEEMERTAQMPTKHPELALIRMQTELDSKVAWALNSRQSQTQSRL